MKYVVGIDLGSTTTKAVVLDEGGRALGRGITNSRSNYDLACQVALTEALIHARFSFVAQAMEERGVPPERARGLLGDLERLFRREQYRGQVDVLERTTAEVVGRFGVEDARRGVAHIVAAMRGMASNGAVRHSGLEHVLAQPEFSDAAEAQELLSLLGGELFLSAMLPRLGDGPDVQVFIGKENPEDKLRRLGIVVSTYGINGEVVGVLGVVGPTRMAYDRSISSVRYMARLMSDLMAELNGE